MEVEADAVAHVAELRHRYGDTMALDGVSLDLRPGLMLGLKCKVANADVVASGYAHALITVPAADNVIRLLPPLTISDDEIAEAVTRLDAIARDLTPA
mgnify:CR=1 FL=1